MALPNLFRLEADRRSTPSPEPEVGLALLERQGHPTGPAVGDGHPQLGQVLEESVEEDRRHEQVGVLHVGDRLHDAVAHPEPLRHPLGEAAVGDGIGAGDVGRRVDAGHHAELGCIGRTAAGTVGPR